MQSISAMKIPSHIISALSKASGKTSATFDYLVRTAKNESNFSNQLQSDKSSAAGMFQFVENTWLHIIHEEGEKFGLGEYSSQIFKTRNGRYYVPDAKVREEILDLRHNHNISAIMAGALAERNAKNVTESIGRSPTEGELYLAHFLGSQGASKLIALKNQTPDAHADTHFPVAAKVNRGVFYTKNRPRSVSEVYDRLTANYDNDRIGKADPATAGLTTRENWNTSTVRAINFAAGPAWPKYGLASTSEPLPQSKEVGKWETIVEAADGKGAITETIHRTVSNHYINFGSDWANKIFGDF
jgi:hypothetical protein